MCEFESNILKLLKEEQTRLNALYADKNAPYMKSLAHGIQQAEEKLKQCEYKKCVEQVSKQNPEIVPSMSLQHWSNMKAALFQCKTTW